MLQNLPADIQAVFQDYLKTANKLVPDPKDDQKLFRFVILCHQNNAAVDSLELYEILEEQGFDEAMQDHLVLLTEGGRELLKAYDKALGK